MEAHYETGPLDQMFDLAERTTAERALIEEVGSLLDALNHAFSETTTAMSASTGPSLRPPPETSPGTSD
ncbi:MAG: hypothetical protein ACRDPE_11015 [Solirubrobacterales bacterium]